MFAFKLHLIRDAFFTNRNETVELWLSFIRGVFSLAVQNLGIRSLGLRSLRSISGGLILLHNNSQLCYTDSLPWSGLLHPTQGPHYIVNHNQEPRDCGGSTRLSPRRG